LPFSNIFRGRTPSLRDRVRRALTESRDGDAQGAIATISERFAEALDELRATQAPRDPAWQRLAAQLQFRAGLMAEAAQTAEQALAAEEDPQTWHLLGRVRIWLQREDAALAFGRAAALDPDAFVLPYRVSRDRFASLAESAFAAIPPAFTAQLDNALVVVDDLPDIEAVREGEDPDVLGIYDGATAMDRGLPERIVLYRRNHENISRDEATLTRQVTETMRHEIGHHFGMEEDELPY
jgi:predicted Zn-dependent protease with MMP-like domain